MPENPPMRAADSKPSRLLDIALAVLMLVLLLAFYLPAIRGEPVFDDDRLMTMPDLRSLHGLWRIWFSPPPKFSYYPVFHTVMWLEHRLWGDLPAYYHLANILQHAAAAWLVVAIMRRLALPGAWLAAFIFALHPVCVESVAWISEQKNTMSTLFYLVSALLWLRFESGGRKRWYVAAVGFFLLAVLSKTTAATLPGALLVIAWWRKGRLNWKRDVLPLVPWFVAGAALAVLSGGIEREGYDVRSSDFSLSLTQHFLLACREVWFYAAKLFWPVNLMFNYPRWQINAAIGWQWLFPAGLLAVTAGLCMVARRNRGPLTALLLFAGNLFPVMGFFYIDWFMFSFVADHFQYVASLGLIVPITSGLAAAARKANPATLWTARTAAGILLVLLCSLTWSQSLMYRGMEPFYQRMIEDNPGSGMAHYDYGLVLLKVPGHLTEAMDQMEEALRLKPDDTKLQDQIGFIFLTTPGRAPDAVTTLKHSLGIDPNDGYAHFLLGSALFLTGDAPGAVTELEQAVRFSPNEPETHYLLANALASVPGRLPEAIAEYRKSLALNPDVPEAHFTLANALAATPGQTENAITEYEEALRLKPDFAEAHFKLADVLSALPGRKQEAVVHYEEALRLRPDLDAARARLRELGSGH